MIISKEKNKFQKKPPFIVVKDSNVEFRSCQKINTKVPYSTAFKLIVNFNDRKKLCIPNSWPEDKKIFCFE